MKALNLPEQRSDANSMMAHAQLLEKKSQGTTDVYFLGDSITRRWGATDYPELLQHWQKSFFGWNAANFGWGKDGIQHILWRLQNGELDGIHPKVLVLLAGTNNIGQEPPAEGAAERAQAILLGLKTLRQEIRARAPRTTLIQMGIFPRNDNPAAADIIAQVNQTLAALAAPEKFHYLEINRQLCDSAGKLRGDYSSDGLHLINGGYEAWAQALKPLFLDLLGLPAKTDLAPAPTGDPSATR